MIDIANYSQKKFSQRGEDGMINIILRTLGIKRGWCCEFGAWDGIHLSNVYNLIQQGWKGVLIEGDPDKYEELQWNMKDNINVYCHNGYVSLEGSSKLNAILSNYPIPCDFDVLSIDIDSYDYWVWASLTYNPKIVVIEYNPYWKDSVTVPYEYPAPEFCYDQYFGASAAALANLGFHKGYDLIGVVPYTNLFFIRKGLNRDIFSVVNLLEGKHLRHDHLRPLTAKQRSQLIHCPPLRWEEVR